MVEERELVERLSQGDRAALESIYEAHKLDLLRIGGCMLVNRTDAEDCLHDVFVSLAANSPRLRSVGNLKGYLVAAMANRARDRLRKTKRAHTVGDDASNLVDEVVQGNDPSAAMIATEGDARLYQAITALPAEQRTVISLHLHGEMTFDEIARLENVSNNTIRSRYRYGLDKLRSSLGAGVER